MSLGSVSYDLSNAQYHAHPAISKSCLDQIARSPFHFYANYLAPERPERTETLAMKMGTLFHCAILEPDEVKKRFIVRPDDIDARTKIGKEWMASVPPDISIITSEQLADTQKMRAALMALPDIAAAFAEGMAETSVFCFDELSGLDLKIRPDWIFECDDGGVILFDVKTTSDASPREFARSCANYRYHVQAAFYSYVYAKATGRTVHAFVFAVVESTYPFVAACYQLNDASMNIGRDIFRADLQKLKACREFNHWPAYGSEMQILSLPTWALVL